MMLWKTSIATITFLIFGQVEGQGNGIGSGGGNGNGNGQGPPDFVVFGPARCTAYLIEAYMVNATDPDVSHEATPVCEMDAEFENGIPGIMYELEGVPPGFYDDVEFAYTSISISNVARDKRRFNMPLPDNNGFKLKVQPGAVISKEKIANNQGRGPPGQGRERRGLRGTTEDDGEMNQQQVYDGHRRRLSPTTGTSTLLVIYAVPPAGTPQNNARSAAQLANEIFGNLCTSSECTVDDVNVKSQIMDCSKNQLEYVPASGVSQIVNGILQVSLSQDVTGVASGTVVNWAKAAAEAILNPSSIYVSDFTQVMYVIPSEASWDGAAAWAQLPGTVSAFQDDYSYRVGVQVHEFGHNMGLHHSGFNSASYADHSCMMGNPSYDDDGPKICWNGAKSWESGWYTDKSLTVDPSIEPFDGLLIGVADFVTNTYTNDHYVVLQIIDNTKTQDYYVMYNRKKVPNEGVTFAADKVTVTLGYSRQVSWHQAALGASTETNVYEKFRVANFNGGSQDLVIKVCSLTMGPPDTAHVLVYLDDGPAYNNGDMCPGEFPCLTDAHCEDGNLCTINTCDTVNKVCLAPTDVTCPDDEIFCNGVYSCNANTGTCDFTSGPSLCDDNNPCTNDSCDAISDSCQHIGIPGCQEPGALIETWTGIGGTTVDELKAADGYPDSPDDVSILTNGLEAPTNTADNFGSRVRGYIVPFVSGGYYFYIASDDNGQLLLSNSIDPAFAEVIAFVPGWAGPRQWTKYSEQKSALISLVAGNAYYIEALFKEGGGGDNLAIGWESPIGSANIPLQVIGAEHVFRYPPVPCTTDNDCDDSNWCTQNTCNGLGLCETVDISATLCEDDGLVCTGVNECDPSGVCIFTNAVDLCFDGNPCTEDQCNDSLGGCLNTPIDGCENGALLETWNNIDTTSVSTLTSNANYPDSPDASTILTSLLEAPNNRGSNFGSRLRTYIYPPASGSYTFYIASDDNGQLWLGTSADPSSATLIASVPGWAASRVWNKFASQKSSPIVLEKGKAYYLEALYKEAGGGDNLAIAWESIENGIPLEVISTTFTTLDVPSSPSAMPSTGPTTSMSPSGIPSSGPSPMPSTQPSSNPTVIASGSPSSEPSIIPTEYPTGVPSSQPSAGPTVLASGSPSSKPTAMSSSAPSLFPSIKASFAPSTIPTFAPSISTMPSSAPSNSTMPSSAPSDSTMPSFGPTGSQCLPDGSQGNGSGCNPDLCCSKTCQGSGNPSNRQCTAAPVSSPTPPSPPTTASPVAGSCTTSGKACSANTDCCSINCKGNGTCK